MALVSEHRQRGGDAVQDTTQVDIDHRVPVADVEVRHGGGPGDSGITHQDIELTQLVDAVPPLLAEHPPLRALTCWLQRLVEYARVKRGVMAAIEASAWRDLYSDQRHRLDEALGVLLDQGKAAGHVRQEVDAADVILLLGALSRIPESEWDRRAHTIVAVIVDGLRPR